jgi:hypothetical protein
MFCRKKFILWILSGFCLLLLYSFFSAPISCKEILQNTITTVENIQTLKFHLKCNERVKGKLAFTESQVKLNTSPRRIYIYLKGPELLWIAGENNGNALVNPYGFPYMNINLDPMGSLLRENQHHTINEIGFSYFASIIKYSMQITGDNFEDYFKCGGSINWDNHDCYFITAEYPDFKWIDYTVQKGETLVTIARKLKVSDYMLLEINASKVGSYRDIKANQKIKVPNAYGKKMVIYIDKELFIPRVIKVYDDKGLFESYEYHDLQLNPKIADEEFTREYKGYGF